jgi:hypothetical protein
VNELNAFAWPDLSRWRGIPAGCSLSDVRNAFGVPPGDWNATGYVGEAPREVRWLSASVPSFPDSVRVWYCDGLVQVMDTEILGEAADLQRLVARIGPPEVRLDSFFGNAPIPRGEWVYPELGLTLFVEPEMLSPLRVAVYPATTLADYRSRYRIIFGPAVK